MACGVVDRYETSGACKPCCRARGIAKGRKEIIESPTKVRARKQKWKEAHPKKVRAGSRRDACKKHGLTYEQFEERADAQGRCCKICGKHETHPKVFTFHVDHCHRTNRLRAVLCNRCNMGLGCFDDEPELLRRAAMYVQAAAESPAEGLWLVG